MGLLNNQQTCACGWRNVVNSIIKKLHITTPGTWNGYAWDAAYLQTVGKDEQSNCGSFSTQLVTNFQHVELSDKHPVCRQEIRLRNTQYYR